MDSSHSHKCGTRRIPYSANQLPHLHHHRFHIHFSPSCPFHSRLLQPNIIVRPESITAGSCSLPFNSQTYRSQHVHLSDPMLSVKGEKEKLRVEEEVGDMEEEEEEDEDDPVFVLTDEWREFFAKSEAKRRLAKKEAAANRKGK